jgi:hypothetical protein
MKVSRRWGSHPACFNAPGLTRSDVFATLTCMKLPLLFLYVALSATTICAGAGGAEMQDTIRHYTTDHFTLMRAYNLPWSQLRMDRFEKLYRGWQERLPDIDFNALNQTGRIDYILLRNELAGQLNEETLQRERLKEMEDLLSFRGAIQELEAARWRMEPIDMQSAATKISEVAERAKKLKERVEKGKKSRDEKKSEKTNETASASAANESKDKPDEAPLKVSALLARRAAIATSEVRNTLKTWYSFYDGYQPDFSWWLKKPYDEATAALDGYAKYLREEIAEWKGKDEDPLLGEVMGRDALLRNLETEMIAYTPEELIAIGEKEFAWCETEMKKAAKEMGFDDWKQALTKVKSAFVPPGQQDELVAKFAREAIDFVKARDMVTVTPMCEEVWRLTMISPETQKSIPYVAYGGQAVMVAYAKDEMKHEDKLMAMRGNNRHFTRITTAHELIPGHHLQHFAADRNNRQYRGIFSTPFLTEGWALYWEIRLWDSGYGQTPEDKIGMLFWRMHRCARIIVSLKFHLNQMQPKEMVDFLVERVGHEKLGATSEVRRFIAGNYSPLYQCGYMIGGLQLDVLRKEIVVAGKMSEREFNDTVLTYGSMPIELIRAGMLNSPLTRSTKATWRFYEGL